MPKKSKPAAKGPFYFFMMEFKEAEEAAGYRFSGLAEVTQRAGPHWEKLAPHEREPYNLKAKKNKANPKDSYGEKYTAQGRSFSQVESEAAKRRQREEQIQKQIVDMVSKASTNNALGELEVFFISCNYFCVSLTGDYVPAELGMIRYSLADGVMDKLNVLINPRELPLGMALDAEQHSNGTHQLPVPPDAIGEANYEVILEQIFEFLNSSGKKTFPPLFTWNKDIPVVDSVLLTILEATQFGDLKMQVLPLIDLFFHLKRATENYGLDIETFPSVHMAKALLETDVYAYTAGIACEIHEKLNNQVACALSRCVRWAYVISDSCCLDMGIEMEGGRHLPFNMTTLSDITGTVSALSSRMSKLTTTTATDNTRKLSRPRSSDRTDRDTTTTTIYSTRTGTVGGKPVGPKPPSSSRATVNDTFNTTNPFYAMQMAQNAGSRKTTQTKPNPWSRENKLAEVRDPIDPLPAPVAGRGRGTLVRMNAAGRGRGQNLCTTVKTVGRGHLN